MTDNVTNEQTNIKKKNQNKFQKKQKKMNIIKEHEKIFKKKN